MFWIKYILKISILPAIFFWGFAYLVSWGINWMYYKMACFSLVETPNSKIEMVWESCKFKESLIPLSSEELKEFINSGNSGLIEAQQIILHTIDMITWAMLLMMLVWFLAHINPKVFRKIEELRDIEKKDALEMHQVGFKQKDAFTSKESQEDSSKFQELQNSIKYHKKAAKTINKIYI